MTVQDGESDIAAKQYRFMNSSDSQGRRLFFALWPDAVVRHRLQAVVNEVHAACGGRPTRAENLHLTLAFLGAVPQERIAAVFDVAATVLAPSFDWRLDRLGSFHRIAWMGGDTLPALTVLSERLVQGLRQAGFPMDERPFAPHVTLVRDAHCERLTRVASILPIDWSMKTFVLAESQAVASGVRYVIIGRWPLADNGSVKRAISPPPSRASKSK